MGSWRGCGRRAAAAPLLAAVLLTCVAQRAVGQFLPAATSNSILFLRTTLNVSRGLGKITVVSDASNARFQSMHISCKTRHGVDFFCGMQYAATTNTPSEIAWASANSYTRRVRHTWIHAEIVETSLATCHQISACGHSAHW